MKGPSDWPKGCPYDELLSFVKKQWERSVAPSVIKRVFDGLVRAKPLKGIYISEHDSGDFECGECTGAPVRTWLMSPSGLQAAELPAEPLPFYSAISSPFSAISFCWSRSAESGVFTQWDGPRASFGCRFSVKYGALKLGDEIWRS